MRIDWAFRLRSLFRRRAVEHELDDELRFHLDEQIACYVRQGLNHDDAVRRARLEFGGLDQIKEEHRDARGISWIEDLGRDVRHGARQIWRSPGFALVAVLCLGIGIGANTAMFSAINSVLLQPLPVADPERVLTLTRSGAAAFSFAEYPEVLARTRTLSGLAIAIPMESDLEVDRQSHFVAAEMVSASYAEVLGVRPVLGRWFTDEREPAAVISHGAWERYFDASPDTLGRVIRSGAESYTIVGVAPQEYAGVFAPMRTDLWVPIQTRPRLAAQLDAGGLRGMLRLFGRLEAGATMGQAAAELNAIDAALQVSAARASAAQGPGPDSPILVEQVTGIPDAGMRRRVAMLTTLLSAVVAVVLLIACVNVGHLLLVRGALRQREMAVRRALGATRFRVFRQLLSENLALALCGGASGLLLAWWANRVLAASVPPFFGIFAVQWVPAVDWRVVLFALSISLAALFGCGLLPAWRTSANAQAAKLSADRLSALPRRRPLGLVAQMGMSLVLLFLAGSFLQAILWLQAADPGFEVEGRLYAYTFVPSPTMAPESRRQLYTDVLDELRGLPDVRAAGLASSLPLMPPTSDCASVPDGPQLSVTTAAVDTAYFQALGIDLLAGRSFAAADLTTGASNAVVVNEALARHLGGRGAAVGTRLAIGCDTAEPATVVGVVRDSAIRGVGEPAQPHVYRPLTAREAAGLTAIFVHGAGSVAALAPRIRAVLAARAEMRVYTVEPLRAYVDQRYAQLKWLTATISAYGVLALVLAAVGLYGVMAYRVTLCTRDIGVRFALGASRASVFREVVGYGLGIVLAGVLIGEFLAAVLTGLIGATVEGLRPTGAATHVAVALIWLAVALAACYLPAARAARMNPVAALRHE